MDKLRVFISSTMEDLKEERSALANAINNNFFWESVYAESFVARSESPKEICLEEVRRSHIYIGIFKNRYGYVPDDDKPEGLSVVESEYIEARKNHLPIFIFVDKNSSDRDVRLIKFLSDLTDYVFGHWRKEYSTIDELIISALEAINREIVKVFIETIDAKRRSETREIYKLPYFELLKAKLIK